MRALYLAGLVAVAGGILGCGGGKNPDLTTPKTTVLAGSSASGATDGPIFSATFNNPVNVAVATDGTVYVCDYDNDRIRQINGGNVSTLVNQSGFSRPFGITLSATGTLYVETDANDLGARDGTTGTIWTINRTSGVATVVARNLGRPRGLCALPDGRIAFSNLTRNTVQILDPSTAAVTTLAGEDGVSGSSNGTGTAAHFDRPYGLTRLTDGSLLVADQNNNQIRRVTATGDVTTYAGTGVVGADNGTLASATFNGPQDIKRAPDGRIFIADTTGKLIRVVKDGKVTTFAGNGTAGYADGEGSAAEFFGLEGIAVSPDGTWLYVADGTGGEDVPYNRVRRFRI